MPDKATKAAITRLVKAAEANAWKGSYPPDHWPDIEHEFTAARAALERRIDAAQKTRTTSN